MSACIYKHISNACHSCWGWHAAPIYIIKRAACESCAYDLRWWTLNGLQLALRDEWLAACSRNRFAMNIRHRHYNIICSQQRLRWQNLLLRYVHVVRCTAIESCADTINNRYRLASTLVIACPHCLTAYRMTNIVLFCGIKYSTNTNLMYFISHVPWQAFRVNPKVLHYERAMQGWISPALPCTAAVAMQIACIVRFIKNVPHASGSHTPDRRPFACLTD